MFSPVYGAVDDRDTMRYSSIKPFVNNLWDNAVSLCLGQGLPVCDIEIFYVTSNCPVEKVANNINCKAFDPIFKCIEFKIDRLLVPITVQRDSLYINLINKIKVTAFVCVCVCMCVCRVCVVCLCVVGVVYDLEPSFPFMV